MLIVISFHNDKVKIACADVKDSGEVIIVEQPSPLHKKLWARLVGMFTK